MGGFEPKIKVVEIPKVEIPRDFSMPKLPDFTRLSPHLSEEGLDQFAQNRALDPKMEITPDLHFNAAVRYTDIALVMGKKGGDSLPPERWETFNSGDGPFARDGIIRFRNEKTFNKGFWDLFNRKDINQKLKTISREGVSGELGYVYHAASFGTVDHSGSPLKITVEITSEMDRPGPDWEYFTLGVFTLNPLSPQSVDDGDDENFLTEIKIHINNSNDAENLLQQFVKEYQRTGSAVGALDWLKESPWGERIFDFPPIIAEDPLKGNFKPPPEASTKEVFQMVLDSLESGMLYGMPEAVDLIQHVFEKIILDPARYPLLTQLPARMLGSFLGNFGKFFPNSEAFSKAKIRLWEEKKEPTTITWNWDLSKIEGFKILVSTAGFQDRGGILEKIEINTMGEAAEGKSFYLTIVTPTPLIYNDSEISFEAEVLNGEEVSFQTFLLKIRTRDPDIIRAIHQQFADEYLRTGSIPASLVSLIEFHYLSGFIDIDADVLLALLETPSDPMFQAALVRYLGKVENQNWSQEILLALRKARKDPYENVRFAAVEALGEIGKKEVINDLLESLNDSSPEVGDLAARTLKKVVGGKETTVLLIKALKSKNPTSRLEAAKELGKMGGEEALSELRAIVSSDSDFVIREYATKAILKIEQKMKAQA